VTNPSGDFPFFDLNSLFGGLRGGDPWKTAADVATAIASEGGSEFNLEPADRLAIEQLARVAELHVNQSSGLQLPAGTTVTPVTRGNWSRQSLEAYRPILERFAAALAEGMQPDTTDLSALGPELFGGALQPGSEMPPEMAEMTSKMMAQVFASLGPMLVATSAGSMMGHLGLRALGQYDLPVPRAGAEVLVVPATIDVAAMRWDVPADDLRLWILVHELTAHAVLSVPHVASRLETLLIDFASAFRSNPEALTEKFGQITDLGQLQEISASMSDPEQVLSLLRTPAHDLLMPQLDALVAAVLGYVDYTVNAIATGLIASHEQIRDRFRQRWAEADPADRFMERLLGLQIDAATIDRGDRFVSGVLDRAGEAGLARLWADELDLPTAAEVDAPGLWLARIGLDTEALDSGDSPAGSDTMFDVPDDLSGLDGLD
jgi:putative hydrolase